MSVFILGVLSGWLVEWLFYNFYWKSRKKENSVNAEAETVIDKKDDLNTLFGIGPSMVKHLQKVGVSSFKQLGEIDVEVLKEKFIENDVTIINKAIIGSWGEQAKLAESGDLDALKALQNKLKKS